MIICKLPCAAGLGSSAAVLGNQTYERTWRAFLNRIKLVKTPGVSGGAGAAVAWQDGKAPCVCARQVGAAPYGRARQVGAAPFGLARQIGAAPYKLVRQVCAAPYGRGR